MIPLKPRARQLEKTHKVEFKGTAREVLPNEKAGFRFGKPSAAILPPIARPAGERASCLHRKSIWL
jgi:hypothetical protein